MTQEGPRQFASPPISAGTRLNGVYEIERFIASGGMGDVYRGHAIQTGDPIAIKIIRPDLAQNEAALSLFRKEAAALHNLHHEAIVQYYVFAVDPTLGAPYLAMEFVDGQSLSDLLRSGPLTFEAVLALMRRVAGGLQAAHERGIVHRDVSPDNIIIPSGDVGRAKLIDFGIAKSLRLGDGTVIGGGFAGKYNYVSPEQLGLAGGEVTAKSDIYSMGLVLVEALQGQPVDMGGSQTQVVEKRRKVPELGAIDLRIRPLIEAMLQPLPADRPESMAAVAAWPIGSSSRPTPRPVSSPSQALANPPRRRAAVVRGAAIASLLLVVAAGAAGLAWYLGQGTPPDKAPPAPTLQSAEQLGGAPPAAPAPPAMTPAETKSASASSGASPATSPSPASPHPVQPSAASQEGRPASPAPATAGTAPTAVEAPATPSISSGPATGRPAAAMQPSAMPASPDLPDEPEDQTPSAGHPKSELALLPPAEHELAPTTAAARITSYINSYDGGDCFFVTPISVSDNSASIEGYGSSAAPFEALDGAFRRAMGFEADIGVREVTTAQCPAITFLNRSRGGHNGGLRLEINPAHMRDGESLTGSIEGAHHVTLLVVYHDGMVENISDRLKASGDARSFKHRIEHPVEGSQSELVMAINAPGPLTKLKSKEPADELFPTLLAEAARSERPWSVAAKYFKLEK
jgi:serine/threonine-protein kinase